MKLRLLQFFASIVLFFIFVASQNPHTSPPDCDIITLRTGEEISAKVIKVGSEEVEYKKCDNVEGPLYSVKSQNVFMIKYANGVKDIISKEGSNEPKKERVTEKNSKTSFIILMSALGLGGIAAAVSSLGAGAELVLIFGGIGGGVLFILSIIFAIVGLSLFAKYPDKFEGKGFAITTLIVAYIMSLVSIVIWGLLLGNTTIIFGLGGLFLFLSAGIYFLMRFIKKSKKNKR